jgi:hypothetical protein
VEGKLGLYDILGRVVPGGFLLWAARWIDVPSGIDSTLKGEPAAQAVFLLIVAYALGLLCSAVGGFAIQKLVWRLAGQPSHKFLKGNGKVADQLAELDLDGGWKKEPTVDNARLAFFCCLAIVEDGSPKLQSIQAQYGIHRNLGGAAFILTVASVYGTGFLGKDWRQILVWLVATIVFGCATAKWGETFARNAFHLAIAKVSLAKAAKL